jgi:hypothetical protein
MRIHIEQKFNQLAKTPKTHILLIEETDEQPTCRICGKSINDNDWCWFCKEKKLFNCSDCCEDGEIQGIKSGYKLPKLHNLFTGVNTLPILLKFKKKIENESNI